MIEPLITINGVTLCHGQAMTLRCAITSFEAELSTEGLGADEMGMALTKGYVTRAREIMHLMFKSDEGAVKESLTVEQVDHIADAGEMVEKAASEFTVGCFYWVLPALDPDAEDKWEMEEQPARYAGKNDSGEDLWHCLNLEGASSWYIRKVGARITQQTNADAT